jgi:hypothetical protein
VSWQEILSSRSATFTALCEYIDERIKSLTAVCTSPSSTEAQIRAAQAGIVELRRIRNLPDRMQQGETP